MSINEYPGLVKAALEIGYDNDVINRTWTEESFLEEIDAEIFFEHEYELSEMDLQSWSNWLDSLPEEQLKTVCCGECEEAEKILVNCPSRSGLEELLELIFDC